MAQKTKFGSAHRVVFESISCSTASAVADHRYVAVQIYVPALDDQMGQVLDCRGTQAKEWRVSPKSQEFISTEEAAAIMMGWSRAVDSI
jgi:hypothetical protein